jgi:N12 class adenine-specific DNA methylase/trans-aconitate methyltransferase
MLLDSEKPISEPCARSVEPAVAALLRLGITQQEVVEHLSRALGIVRCVLDYQQSIPRHQLAVLGRTLWTRIGQIRGVPPETVRQVRATITACVADLRLLPEESTGSPEEQRAPPQPAPQQAEEQHPSPTGPALSADTEQRPDPRREEGNGHGPRPSGGLVGSSDVALRQRTAFQPRSNGTTRSPAPSVRPPRQRTLFDFLPSNGESGEPAPAPDDTHPEKIPETSHAADALKPPAIPGPRVEQDSLPVPFVVASGEKAKARDILAAIRTLQTIEQERRAATAEEKQTLARFAGFGPVALSIFPDPVTGRYKDIAWQALGEELKASLSPGDYDSAKRTTFNAFYTSPTVIAAMHDALARLGVAPGATVLEPGCGTGNFMSQAAPGMRFIGIELDSISGRIARALHPGQDIRIENFRDTRLPDDRIDAVIGNVPFADLKLDYHGQKLSLHDYFFAKSLDALRPGGVLALVTSHFTLDKQNAALREYMAERADFLGAIRLPSDAFKREGTSVVTDIVFLRRRASGDPAAHTDPEWLGVQPIDIDGDQIPISRYFLKHPDMVLGTWSRKDRLYDAGYSLIGNGDLAGLLTLAIERLPECAPSRVSPVQEEPVPAFTPPPLERHITEGSFFVDPDGDICQSRAGESVPVVYGGTTLRAGGTHTGKRLAALVRLRDHARRVLQSQNEGWPDTDRHDARRELNWAYDRFVATYGPINKTTFGANAEGRVIRRMPNLVKFREDPDAMLVMSLEEYDEPTGKAAKAAILKKDVVGKIPPVTQVRSAEEGLLVALDRRGRVDVAFIAELYGKPEDQVVTELGDLIYHDPDHQTWQTADQYLSGNVRAKLAAVLNTSPANARNAEALRAVQPEDVLPGDIDANLGAPWIPDSDIQAFVAQLFQVEPDSIQIGHVKKDAVWSIEADYAASRSVAATSEYGTPRAGGFGLLELALNMKTPTIYDVINHGDREERVVNQEATLAAREKQRQIKECFRSWIFTDPDRTERLVRLYNDTYNNLRLRQFDGSHLDFPGLNQTVELRPHQKDAVWRGMSSGNTLLAHCVGAGKTFTMAATGMKMKQAGLIQKPMYVVPNHLLEQFSRELLQLYPNAQLLVATKEDLTRERRKFLTAKIASGAWDGILITHSSFERIGMSRPYQEAFLGEQIKEYDQLLIDGAGRDQTRAHRNLIKTIEKQKAKREERLKDLLAEDKKDDGLVFDELGVDHVFIDESHYFKNLETPTKMERVAGIQTGGSERAFDLYMKARYLDSQHLGHGVTFATGTPISNTMVEMYTVQRFLDPEGLRSRGIEHFDAWAATFGEVVDAMEISPDGKTLKPRSRFGKFTNLPELQQLFRSFADVQTAEMLDLPRPTLEGGKASVVACPMSDEQQHLQLMLVARYERLRSQKVDPREDNALAITTDGRKLALDARMLSSDAPDFPGSKVNALVEGVASIWQRTAGVRGAQMIFCDMGVHPTPWGYSAYEEIISKLIARGVPPSQIAAVGEADSDAKKQALFERVRNGQVRVLLGSTQKMGTGTNVQKRLVALHHLDAPWKPAEVEQREGRILRQGNENAAVAIYRYVTEGSFDAYMWQALETKARFIAQVITGDNALRSAEDIGGQELSYAEVKAIASGNPAVLTLAEADAELQRLTVLKKNHADEQFLARRNVRDLPQTISQMSERLSGLTADLATIAARGEDLVIGKRPCSYEDAIDILGGHLDSLPQFVREIRRLPLGQYRGLQFGIVLHPQWTPEVYLEGAATRQDRLSREHHGPRAVLNALERLAGSYKTDCECLRRELVIAETQLRDYQARLGKPFLHDSHLAGLTSLRDQLKVALSGTPPEATTNQVPTASELAAEIKALQASYRIEAAPERIGKRRSSAEEPVTARIRRRMASLLAASEGHLGIADDTVGPVLPSQ